MEQEQAKRGGTTTRFTALELAAAEQLIHLSESSCSYSSGAAFSLSPRGAPAPSAASASSSPRSVNAPVPAAQHAEGDEDGQGVGGRPRRNRKYRPIAEIYDVTEPAGARRRKGR